MAEAGVETTAHVASGQVIGTALGGDLALAALALARRFAAGATMWCLAPAWPEHARHVAVEFVHPVIMGKRALARGERRSSPTRSRRSGRRSAPAT